jgi:Haemolymph juvenile hormone binding protein (JHBP).
MVLNWRKICNNTAQFRVFQSFSIMYLVYIALHLAHKQLTRTAQKGIDLSPCSADCKAHVVLDSELEERNGYKFPKVKTLKIDFTVGKGSVQLMNLFGGDKVLGK